MLHAPRAPEETLAPVFVPDLCEPKNRGALLLAAILASSLGFIDGSVTAIALPAMRASLDATLQGAQWISNSYLLVLSSLVLAGGAMGDRFGVTRVFRLGILIFVGASLGCAVAQDSTQMIAARTVQGLGAALMVPASMALIARIYPPDQRGRALGIWAAASTATTALGPVVAGLLISYGPEGGWRLVFAINLPFGVIALWLLATRARDDTGRPGQRVDYLGAALATAGLGLVTLALTRPGVWSIAWGLAGVVVLALFVLWQARARAPMVRLGLFRSRNFSAVNLATFFLYFALSGVMFYLPMTALSAWGVTAIEVTAAFVPTSILIGILSAPAGRLSDRIGAAPLMMAGAGLVAAGYLGLALTAHEAAFWARAVPFTVLAALGMALVVAPLTSAVMAFAGDDEQGAASGVNNAVARVSGLFAVAVLGSLAVWLYGKTGAGTPGFGLAGGGEAHRQATGAAFAAVAGVSAVCAAIAAVISALVVRTGGATARPKPAA